MLCKICTLRKVQYPIAIGMKVIKKWGAPEEFYVANGYLLVTIEAVAGMRNQVVFKGIKMDPAVELTEHPAIGWYGREGFAIPQFKAFYRYAGSTGIHD